MTHAPRTPDAVRIRIGPVAGPFLVFSLCSASNSMDRPVPDQFVDSIGWIGVDRNRAHSPVEFIDRDALGALDHRALPLHNAHACAPASTPYSASSPACWTAYAGPQRP